MPRTASITRKTLETDITATLNIDGEGVYHIACGIGFLDHMLAQLSKHSRFDIDIKAKGDLHIDAHHTTEDIGLTLGACFKEAIGAKKGIMRYGHCIIPMDEALIMCAIDLSDRPYLNFSARIGAEMLGDMQSVLVKEFFKAFVSKAGITLHITQLAGEDPHHIAEGIFKAAAHALLQATRIDDNIQGVLSTK